MKAITKRVARLEAIVDELEEIHKELPKSHQGDFETAVFLLGDCYRRYKTYYLRKKGKKKPRSKG